MTSNVLLALEEVRSRDLAIRLERSRAMEYLMLAAITLLAAGSRFFKLGQWSFWEDEIFTLNDAQRLMDHLSVLPPPSLSTALTALIVQILGTSEWSARLASALIGALSVPILYFLIQRVSSTLVALISSLLLAVAPWHIFWSQNARFYTALLLFYTLALLFLFVGLERDRFPYIALSIVFLVLAVGERFSAGLLVPVVAVYLLLAWRLPIPKPAGLHRTSLRWLPGLSVLAMGLLAALLVMKGDQFLSTFLREFVGNPIHDPARLLYQTVYKLGIPLVIFGLVSGIHLVTQKRNRLALVLLCAAIVPIVMLVAISAFVFVEDRYAFVTLPAWIVLVALGVQESMVALARSARPLAAGILLVLVGTSLNSDLLYYVINDGDHADWRRAFATVQAQLSPADLLVSTWPEVGEFYVGGQVQRFSQVEPATVVATGRRYWFVVDVRTVWATPTVKQWLEQNGSLVDRLPLRIPEDEGLLIYRYEPTQRQLSGSARDLAAARSW